MKINKLPAITHSEGIGAVNIILIEKINELIDAFYQFNKEQDLLIDSVMHSKKEKELEILRCPFCGHNAAIKEQNIVKIPYYKITCENKYCSSLNYMSTKEEAIKFWNKRYK